MRQRSVGGSRYLLLAATFSMSCLRTRTWECLCVSIYLLIIMAVPPFSECVVWTLVHFAESFKRCDLYVTLAAIFQQCTEPRQSYNCRYVIIQAIHFSSDTELFKPQKINIAHVDWQLNRSRNFIDSQVQRGDKFTLQMRSASQELIQTMQMPFLLSFR